MSGPRRALHLLLRGEDCELHAGEHVIGRDLDADFVLPHPLVSRRHARLVVTDDEVTIEDLDSANGVWVNELRIDGPTALEDGDRILIGTFELSVFMGEAPEEPTRSKRRQQDYPTIDQRLGPECEPLALDEPGVDDDPERVTETRQADAFQFVGGVANKMLQLGRVEAAERMLETHLDNVLDGARRGDEIERQTVEGAVKYALELAEAMKSRRWLGYAFELHIATATLMAGEVIDRVARLARDGFSVDPELLRAYQATVRSGAARLTGADRTLADRILCLEVESG